MTLTVICGQGHINSYNLTTTDSLSRVTEFPDGTVLKEEWDWTMWNCPQPNCEHREYVTHHINAVWTEKHGEEKKQDKTLLTALMLLAIMLSIKTRIGI